MDPVECSLGTMTERTKKNTRYSAARAVSDFVRLGDAGHSSAASGKFLLRQCVAGFRCIPVYIHQSV